METIQDNDITPVEIIIHETIEKGKHFYSIYLTKQFVKKRHLLAETQKPDVTVKKSPVVTQKSKEIPAIGNSQNVEDNLDKLAAPQTNNKGKYM